MGRMPWTQWPYLFGTVAVLRFGGCRKALCSGQATAQVKLYGDICPPGFV